MINVSTRAYVGTTDDRMIAGFVIGGSGAKQVVIRAVGPTLADSGVTGALANPKLEIFDQSGGLLATNDDWQSSSQAAEIEAAGLAPPNSLEPAVLLTLEPGAYTAVVSGSDGGTGVGLVAVDEIETAEGCGNRNARSMSLDRWVLASWIFTCVIMHALT